jgi:hypothetical protein
LSISPNLCLTAECGTSALNDVNYIIIIGCDGELQELMADLGINTAGTVGEKHRDHNLILTFLFSFFTIKMIQSFLLIGPIIIKTLVYNIIILSLG